MEPKRDMAMADFVMVIDDLDLSRSLSDDLRRELRDAFRRSAVMIFRNQDRLRRDQLQAVAEIFGTYYACQDISNLGDDDALLAPDETETRYRLGNGLWHMDMTVLPQPPFAAMLVAKELPQSGGQTQFADLVRAFRELPGAQKRRLRKLTAHHELETLRRTAGITDPEELKSPYRPAEHPLVCTDPYSGRETILLSAHIDHIQGLPAAESDALLRALKDTVTRPEYVYTHTWRPDDLLLWANWRIMHRVLPYDHVGTRRRLWRAEIATGAIPRPSRRGFFSLFR